MSVLAYDHSRVRRIVLDTCAADCCWRHPAIEAAADRACADAADEQWMRRETKKTLRRLTP